MHPSGIAQSFILMDFMIWITLEMEALHFPERLCPTKICLVQRAEQSTVGGCHQNRVEMFSPDVVRHLFNGYMRPESGRSRRHDAINRLVTILRELFSQETEDDTRIVYDDTNFPISVQPISYFTQLFRQMAGWNIAIGHAANGGSVRQLSFDGQGV